MIFVAITRLTVHLVNTIAASTRIKPTIINVFNAHYFHLELRNVSATVICVLIDTPLVRVATVASSRNCICRTSIVFELSGLLVLGVVFFHDLSDSLLHDSELSISQ